MYLVEVSLRLGVYIPDESSRVRFHRSGRDGTSVNICGLKCPSDKGNRKRRKYIRRDKSKTRLPLDQIYWVNKNITFTRATTDRQLSGEPSLNRNTYKSYTQPRKRVLDLEGRLLTCDIGFSYMVLEGDGDGSL